MNVCSNLWVLWFDLICILHIYLQLTCIYFSQKYFYFHSFLRTRHIQLICFRLLFLVKTLPSSSYLQLTHSNRLIWGSHGHRMDLLHSPKCPLLSPIGPPCFITSYNRNINYPRQMLHRFYFTILVGTSQW